MKRPTLLFLSVCLGLSLFGDGQTESSGEVFRVMTWNVWNYLPVHRHIDGQFRPDYPKPEREKEALREVIRRWNPDLILLQEMGPKPYLLELQRDLRREGADYPYAYIVEGFDENRHLAALSRQEALRFVGDHALDLPYFEERRRLRRGLLELQFEVGEGLVTVYSVHLKSRWTEREEDPRSERLRTREAEAIRNHLLEQHPGGGGFFLVAGDFNDHPASAPLRRMRQRGDIEISVMLPAEDRRGHRWTHYFPREDRYSRIDYFLVSKDLINHVVERRATVIDCPEVEIASDHRPLYLDLFFKED